VVQIQKNDILHFCYNKTILRPGFPFQQLHEAQRWTWIWSIHGLDWIGWDDCDPFLIINISAQLWFMNV